MNLKTEREKLAEKYNACKNQLVEHRQLADEAKSAILLFDAEHPEVMRACNTEMGMLKIKTRQIAAAEDNAS